MAATALDYLTAKGIPIDRINTHSLRSGGANALLLAGYSDTQIQKMGQLRGATFKEYIHKELVCFSAGMLVSMKKKFDYVNIAGNAFNTITDALIDREYDINVSSAAAALMNRYVNKDQQWMDVQGANDAALMPADS